jgi:ribose 5-phosphate isomerase A
VLQAEVGKAAAAGAALDLVETGMVLGLGTGSTTGYFIDGLARRVAEGLRVSVVPTSRATAELALAAGIPVVSELDRAIDLAVDGADEVDPRLNLIKGRGGALFREKMVADASTRFVVIADEAKLVAQLGLGVLPVEILPFLWRQTARRLGALGATWDLRGGPETPFKTDNGNLIVDLHFTDLIDDPEALAVEINTILGVIEHGLFIGMASAVLVGDGGGQVRTLGSLD